MTSSDSSATFQVRQSWAHGAVLYRDVAAYFGLQQVAAAMEMDEDEEEFPGFNRGMELLQISQLQVRFEEKADLEDEDLDLLKRHKIKRPKSLRFRPFVREALGMP